MAKNATLTFGMDLSDFDKAMKSINKQATSLSDQINKVTQGAMQAYKNGLSDLKANPFQSAKFHTDLANLKENIKKAVTHKLNLDIEEAKKNLEGLKTQALAAVGSIMAISKPISSAIDFESSMADVKKVVDFSGADDVKKFADGLMKMSREIPLSVNELAQITASGGQLGIAKENLMDFTTTAAKMGVAFDMSAKEAGDNMATMMNIFGMDVKRVGELGDTINHISNNSAATANKIVNALGRIAGNAKDFGLSADAASGLASSFIALGKAPEVAATAINSMLTTLNNADDASGSVAKAFNQIGIDGKELKQAIVKNPQKALTDFLYTLSKISKESKTGVLTAIFGKNFGDDISLVTGAIENYDKAMRLSADKAKAGSMDREFKSRSETTANNIQQMKSAFNEIAINIGAVFLPALNSIMDGIKKISYVVSDFASAFPNLIKYSFGAVIAITAVRTALIAKQAVLSVTTLMLGNYRKVLQLLPFECLQLGASLKECGIAARFKAAGMKAAAAASKTWSAHAVAAGAGSLSFTAGIKNAIVAVRALGAAAMANPIGLIIAVIAAVGFTIYKYWDRFKAFFSGFWEGLKEGLGPLFESLSEYWEIIKTVFAPLKSLFGWLIDCFSSFFSQSEATKESLAGFADAGRTVGKVFAAVIDFVTKPLQWIIGIIKDIFNFMADSKLGKWISGKTGLSVGEKNVSGAIGEQTTAGSVDQVAQDRREMRSQTSQNQITDNKKIDINLYGSQATPQAVAQAVSDNGYSFGD
nr:phage tail tape measure protein [uncultured Campylobacter sp.]